MNNNHYYNEAVLDNAAIARNAPSVFAQSARETLSDKYQFIPTTRVIDLLDQEGWKPVNVKQSRCKTEEGRSFVKHALRLRNPNIASELKQVGDSIPEIVLENSHNGTSAFKLSVGLFRLVCSNGLLVADASFASISIRHIGFNSQQVVDASRNVINSIPRLQNSVQAFQTIQLSTVEQQEFARNALTLRYDESESPIKAEQLLRPRRYADTQNDLWSTYNRVQENLVRGGLRYRKLVTQQDQLGEYQIERRNSTRAITAVDANLKVNRKLWELLDIWAQKKA